MMIAGGCGPVPPYSVVAASMPDRGAKGLNAPHPSGIALHGQGVVQPGEENGKALFQQFAGKRGFRGPAGVNQGMEQGEKMPLAGPAQVPGNQRVAQEGFNQTDPGGFPDATYRAVK
jgi:hypothetical protein